jgi:hypothetical protein
MLQTAHFGLGCKSCHLKDAMERELKMLFFQSKKIETSVVIPFEPLRLAHHHASQPYYFPMYTAVVWQNTVTRFFDEI